MEEKRMEAYSKKILINFTLCRPLTKKYILDGVLSHFFWRQKSLSHVRPWRFVPPWFFSSLSMDKKIYTGGWVVVVVKLCFSGILSGCAQRTKKILTTYSKYSTLFSPVPLVSGYVDVDTTKLHQGKKEKNKTNNNMDAAIKRIFFSFLPSKSSGELRTIENMQQTCEQ